MARLICAFLILLSFQSIAKEGHLPEARVIQMEQGSADDSIGLRLTSQPFHRFPQVKGILRRLNYPFFRAKIQEGYNLTKTSVEIIENFIDERGDFKLLGVKPQNKVLIFITMNLGDPDVTRVLIEAKRRGFAEVRVIVDGQSGLRLKTSPQPKVTRTDDIEFLDNDAGHESKTLIEAGFEINDLTHPYTINTPKVLRSAGMRPLQHMKGVLLLTKGEIGGVSLLDRLYPANWQPLLMRTIFPKSNSRNVFERQPGKDVRAAGYLLTDNATHRDGRNAVYNRMLEILEREVLMDQVDHANRAIEAFATKGAIKDIASLPPQRLEYPDGSFLEQAFTDGRFNTNHYVVDLLKDALAGKITITHAWISEYSLAMDDFVDALQEYMGRNLTMTIPMAVFDPSFVSGSGLAETLAGFTNTSGKECVRGFSAAACNRITGYVRRQEDPNGKAGKMTWHDKTSIFQVKEADGKVWYYILVGSANLTNHSEENSEISWFFKLSERSLLANWFITSITGHVLHKPELFAPIERDSFRIAIGRMLSVAPGKIPTEAIERLELCLRANDYRELNRGLLEIWQKVGSDERKTEMAEIDKRLKLLTAFFEWYRHKVWPEKYYHGRPPLHIPWWTDHKDWVLDRLLRGRTHLRIQQLASIFKLIAEHSQPDLELKQVQRLVNGMSPDSHFTNEKIESLSRELLATLAIKGKFSRLSSEDFQSAVEKLREPMEVKCDQELRQHPAK